MKMTTLLVAALCIPLLMSCGEEPKSAQAAPVMKEAPLKVAPIEIEPNMRMEQQQIMRQAPIQERVEDKLGSWCERELNHLHKELRSGEAQEQGKYHQYLLFKIKGLKAKCQSLKK